MCATEKGIDNWIFSVLSKQKEFNYVINILLRNGYLLDLIFRTLKTRLTKLFDIRLRADITNNNFSNNDNTSDVGYFIILYIYKLPEQLRYNTNEFKICTAYVGLNKLSN